MRFVACACGMRLGAIHFKQQSTCSMRQGDIFLVSSCFFSSKTVCSMRHCRMLHVASVELSFKNISGKFDVKSKPRANFHENFQLHQRGATLCLEVKSLDN